MGCGRGTCPVSRSPIDAGDPVIGLIWAPSPPEDRPVNTATLANLSITPSKLASDLQKITEPLKIRLGRLNQEPGDETVQDLLASIERLNVQPEQAEVLSVTGAYDDYGWIDSDSLNGPEIPRSWTQQPHEGKWSPLDSNAPSGRNATLMHRQAAELLAGEPWDGSPQWTARLISAARASLCELVTSEHYAQIVYPEQFTARQRLQAAHDFGLKRMENLAKADRTYT